MGRLREIPRTATFAWSQSITKPSIATGTRAGAVDADFSNETKLELWDLDLGNPAQASELQPVGSIATDSRFYDLAWSQPYMDNSDGIIAGALESGSLDLWDASKLRTNSEDALISRTTKHSGAIKALQFNPHRPELLATSGAKGELYITDLNNTSNPFRLGTAAARADDFDALDWNKQVAHIMATAGSGGFVTVWDVKMKKESLTLNNYGRKPASAVAWNPDLPTKLATAVPTDQDPLILMWDLRNSSAPERILKGHEQGVLSLSWCPQDSGLLLSCGKDNRNICWDPQVGESVGEFPIVTNWTFQTRWSPRHPSLLATASFDGKIGIQTIQNTNAQVDQGSTTAPQAVDGEDFFAKAHTQPSGSSFSLSKAPKWLKRPVGVSFGFGGKLVAFKPTEDRKKSIVKISTFGSDPALEKSIADFSETLKKEDFSALFEEKINDAETEESKNDWKTMQALISENPRKSLLAQLGFSEDVLGENDAEKEEADNQTLKVEPQQNGDAKANKRLSAFFDNAGENQGFLADLAASKGAKTNNPFKIFTGSESDADKGITRALMLGSFEKALDICLAEKRMSDAFMIAICGGQTCIDKAQTAYFAQQSNGPNYLRLLASVVGKNLWDTVHNADLSNWQEVMATLCTFASETELPDLCEALGDRLEESRESRKDASFCYLSGSKLEKVVPIWIQEMQEFEKARAEDASDESAYSIHVQALQSFVEKVSIYRQATKYQDIDGREKATGWKLDPLYAKYTEYADVVSGYGHLDLAEKYLDLLPPQYPAADVARNRVKQARNKAPSASRGQPSTSIQTQANAPGTRAYGAPGYQQSYTAATPTYTSPNTFANSYQQPISPSTNAPSSYAPPNAFAGGYQAPTQNFGPPQPAAPGPAAGPPPAGPPPSRAAAANGQNWNDLPESFQARTPTSRRGTPVPAPASQSIYTPFPNQSTTPGPPPSGQQKPPTPLPPPPKASGPPRTSSPLVDRPAQPFEQPQRPPSAAASSYAPPLTSQTSAPPPPQAVPARGASPYNAPPAQAPPSNRYAPAPSAQTSQPGISGPPPPGTRPPIAPSPYGGQPGSQAPFGAPAPHAQSQAPPPQGPPPASRGPPPGPPPAAAQSQPAAPPAASRHPAGDRSHIPPESQPIYQILNTEMQRIKGLAPANFKPQVDDTDKRLNILYDLLNNDEIKAENIPTLKELANALAARNFEQALALHTDLLKQLEQQGPWVVGIKRLISMSRATPVA